MVNENTQSGLGLIELIVSMTIVAAMATFAAKQYLSIQNLNRFVEGRDRLIILENMVRFALFNDRALNQTIKKNPNLAKCVKQAGPACNAAPQALALWMSQNIRIDGKYELDGRRCSGVNCPVEMKLNYYTSCLGSGGCQRIKGLFFNYELYVEDIMFKKGVARRLFENTASDEGALCEADDSGRTKFASKILGGRLFCMPSPPFNRKLSGISANDCKIGKELLVGFDASGKPICQKIKYSEKSK